MIILITLFLAIGTCGYKIRHTSSSTPRTQESKTHTLNLTPTYTLSMRAETGTEFDYGKARRYFLQENDSEILLTCNEMGGILSKSLSAKIRFNPQTLRGTWDYNLGGVVQGGEIFLNQSPHGFVFKLTNTIGPYAGSPPSYGTLIANP
jgi:hypothetical protein